MKKTPIVKTSRPDMSRRQFRPVRSIILALFAVILTSSAWQLYQLHSGVTQKIARLNQEKSNLAQERSALEDQIIQLNTPSYIEQLAREQLGLVRKGEISIKPKKK
jgi:cell division protein DivIC